MNAGGVRVLLVMEQRPCGCGRVFRCRAVLRSGAELLALCAVLKEYGIGGIEFTPKGLMEGVAKADFELMGESVGA